MTKTKTSLLRAQKRYDERVAVRKGLKFIKGHDDDIISFIDTVPNFQAYIKDLIRKDIESKR